MILWNVSIVTVLMLALIKLLRVWWCQRHGRLFHRKFLSGGNTWKTMMIWVFKRSQKVAWLPCQHTWRLTGWTKHFLMENTQKEKSQSSHSKLQSILKICCDLGEGAQSAPPGLDRVNVGIEVTSIAVLVWSDKREKELGKIQQWKSATKQIYPLTTNCVRCLHYAEAAESLIVNETISE